MNYPSLLRAIIWGLPLLLIGCLRSEITPREIDADVSRLASINTKSISLSADCPAAESAGHQYLFMFIPFGRIEIADASTMILNTAFTQLALAGYQPSFEAGAARSLRIACLALELSAYDLLFFRRLSGRVELDGVLFDAREGVERRGRGVSSSGESRRFGFVPQLDRLLRREVDEAVRTLLVELHLVS